MLTFWARVKGINFKFKLMCIFWATFGKNLGYFLYQHLVTLEGSCVMFCFKRAHHRGPELFQILFYKSTRWRFPTYLSVRQLPPQTV